MSSSPQPDAAALIELACVLVPFFPHIHLARVPYLHDDVVIVFLTVVRHRHPSRPAPPPVPRQAATPSSSCPPAAARACASSCPATPGRTASRWWCARSSRWPRTRCATAVSLRIRPQRRILPAVGVEPSIQGNYSLRRPVVTGLPWDYPSLAVERPLVLWHVVMPSHWAPCILTPLGCVPLSGCLWPIWTFAVSSC